MDDLFSQSLNKRVKDLQRAILSNVLQRLSDSGRKKALKFLKHFNRPSFEFLLEIEELKKIPVPSPRTFLAAQSLVGDFWKSEITVSSGFLVFFVLPQWKIAHHELREAMKRLLDVMQSLSKLLEQYALILEHTFVFWLLNWFCLSLGAIGSEQAMLYVLVNHSRAE